MPRIATMKAAPMSRKVTQVTSHSPSHRSVGWDLVVGLAVQRDGRLRHACPSRRPSMVVVDRHHAVDRRLVGAGEFAGHHLGRAAVVAEDRIGGLLALHRHHVAELDHRRAPGMALAGTGVASAARRARVLALRQARADRDRLAPAAAMGIADRGAAVERGDGVVDVALLDPVIFEVVLVDARAARARAACHRNRRRRR